MPRRYASVPPPGSRPEPEPTPTSGATRTHADAPTQRAHLIASAGDPQLVFARRGFLEVVGEALAHALEREEVLRELARKMVPEMADYCVAYLVEPDTRQIRRVGLAHADAAQEPMLRQLLDTVEPSVRDDWGVGAVIRSGQGVLTTRVSAEHIERLPDGRGYRDLVRALSPLSSMVLPLRARGQTVGAVSFATSVHSGLFYSEEDLAFATAIARRAAIALDNARLFGEAQIELARRQAAEQALSSKYEQLRIVYQVTQAVSTAAELDEIHRAAISALHEGVGADRASILLFDDDGVMRFKAWSRLSDGYRAHVEGHSPWGPDASDPSPIVVPDVKAAPSLGDALKRAILSEGIRAVAFIPLVSGRSLLGKFMVYFDEPRELQREELDLAQAVARTVSFAITRVKDEHRIRAAKEAAERASQAKSQFLGVMSHELRTPLNSVVGYSELLLLETKGPLSEGQREYVRRIQTSASHQLRLIDELLTYTRLEAGRTDVRLMTTDVLRIVDDVLEFVRPEADGKGLRLRKDVPDSSLQTVTDPARVRQIVLNLVGNAVKFTDGGEIVVRVRRSADSVRVEVQDTGPGIPESELERIWEPFAQVDPLRRRKGGTGLGLSIARRFAELLEGRLTVESRVDVGCTFTLELPLREASS
jgi:signal transduction histidine kinase